MNVKTKTRAPIWIQALDWGIMQTVLKHLHWGHFAPLWCNQAFSLMSSVPLRMSREVLLTRGRDGRKRRGVGGLRDKSSEGAWDGRWRHMARMWSQQCGAGAVSVTWGRLAGRVGGLHCVGACALWLLLTLWWDWWFSAVALVTVTDDQTLFLSSKSCFLLWFKSLFSVCDSDCGRPLVYTSGTARLINI